MRGEKYVDVYCLLDTSAEYGRTATGQQEYGQSPQNPTDNEEEIYSENVSGRRHKKIFTQDDGEYVDFEEIKE